MELLNRLVVASPGSPAALWLFSSQKIELVRTAESVARPGRGKNCTPTTAPRRLLE
jgi:hypothetical protein